MCKTKTDGAIALLESLEDVIKENVNIPTSPDIDIEDVKTMSPETVNMNERFEMQRSIYDNRSKQSKKIDFE